MSTTHPGDPVLVDVDGDGTPDQVTPGPRPAPRWDARPGTPIPPSWDGPEDGIPDRPGDVVPVIPGTARALAEEPQFQDAIDVRVGDGSRLFAHVQARRDAKLRPIIPAVLRSWVEFRATCEVYGHYWAHMAMYHLVRTPQHLWGRAWRVPVGAFRLERTFLRWARDANVMRVENFYVDRVVQARSEAAGKEFQNTRKTKETHWLAFWAAHVGAVLGTVLLVCPAPLMGWLAGQLPGWVPGWLTGVAQILAVIAGVEALARLGTDPDKPIVPVSGVPMAAPKFTVEAVTAALLSLGIDRINTVATKGYTGPGIRYPGIGPHRDGPGCRVDVDLPPGATARMVMEKREELASGIQRPIGCVWPDGAPKEHPGRLVLWVGDKPFSEQSQPRWPLLKTGAADLFRPIPVAWDQRSGVCDILLMENNVLVGALPGAGKTGWGKAIAFAAALDANAELHVHELKGTGDYEPVRPVCHRYTSAPPSDESLESVMNSIREVYSYLAPRATVIGSLPESEIGTDKKVTPALAKRRDLGLHPVVLIVDEVQELFESDHAAEATTLFKRIIKRGRALGIMLVLLTQRPDKESLPRSISSNAGIRVCLRVTGQVENDMILGTSAYKAGMRATMLDEDDKGVGYLKPGARGKIARAHYFDDNLSREVGRRALELRTAAGTLTGDAAGQDWEPDVTITVDVVDDCRRMFADGERGLHGTVLLDRLVGFRPGHYDNWPARQLTGVLKAAGVGRAGVNVKDSAGRVAKGVYLVDLLKAINPPDDEPPAIEAGEEDDDADFPDPEDRDVADTGGGGTEVAVPAGDDH